MGMNSYNGPAVRGLKKTVDWSVVICFVAIMIFGWVNIYAAVQASEPESILDFSSNCGKQALWIATSLGLAAIILFAIKPKIWEVMATPGFVIMLVLLVIVRFGTPHKGSYSWFSLGPVSFQPAEISKITTALMLAATMGRQGFKMDRKEDLLKIGLITGVPMAIIVLVENETGSALVYIGYLFMLYREGLSGWWLAMLGMAILLFVLCLKWSWWVALLVLTAVCAIYLVPRLHSFRLARLKRSAVSRTVLAFIAGCMLIFATGFIFENVLHDHQRKRIEVLLGMVEDTRNIGYNVHQSMIAIGSGGLFGKGYLGGTQTAYGFVPEQSTDFIFCTVGEEWGFAGCIFLIGLYAFMIVRIILDADEARTRFTRIYGYCVASVVFMHLAINIGMTIGLAPVIGIPLPMFSYGGSSLWGFTIMIFIFLALNREENKYF